jgi:phosphoserine aminotransferase
MHLEYRDVPSNYKVIFCQGGGYGQFSFVPMNLMKGWYWCVLNMDLGYR